MDNISPQFELVRIIDVTAQGGSKPVAVATTEPKSVAFANAHGGLRKVTYIEARQLGANSGKSLRNALSNATL